MSIRCFVFCFCFLICGFVSQRGGRRKKKTTNRNRITSNVQCSPAAVAFINANALSRGAWHKLTMKHMHSQPQTRNRKHTHTREHTHGWRLTLCSSVSLLPSPSLHKSQRERRRWEEENAYIKGEHRNKGFMGCKHPPGTKTHTNIYTAWRSRSPTNTFQTGD